MTKLGLILYTSEPIHMGNPFAPISERSNGGISGIITMTRCCAPLQVWKDLVLSRKSTVFQYLPTLYLQYFLMHWSGKIRGKGSFHIGQEEFGKFFKTSV